MVEFKIKPIGVVSSRYHGQFPMEKTINLVSKIIINMELEEALEGIEKHRYIYVLFYFHKLNPDMGRPLKVHIKGDPDKPLVGVLASRAQNRPNPIGMTRVRLIRRKSNVLIVKGLDAFDGSTVIDIKPAIP